MKPLLDILTTDEVERHASNLSARPPNPDFEAWLRRLFQAQGRFWNYILTEGLTHPPNMGSDLGQKPAWDDPKFDPKSGPLSRPPKGRISGSKGAGKAHDSAPKAGNGVIRRTERPIKRPGRGRPSTRPSR